MKNALKKQKQEAEHEEHEQHQSNLGMSESKFNDDVYDEHDNDEHDDAEDGDDGGYGHDEDDEDDYEAEFVLDRKDLLIVKDGTIRVAESLEQQQFDANGEAIKASGTWTKAEHDRFLKAIETYPKGPWKAIAAMVGSRTVRQTQTHAQKYREKMARRMRGLRNRNGTLQYPPAASASGGAMYSRPGGGSVVDHDRMGSAYHLPNSMDRHLHHYHQQQQQIRHHHHHHQVLPGAMVMATPMAVAAESAASLAAVGRHPNVSSSMEFNQLSTSSISSAFIGNTSYPSSWDPRRIPASSSAASTTAAASGKPPVPDFDESMDFLMNVYSSDPSQLGRTALSEDAFFKRE